MAQAKRRMPQPLGLYARDLLARADEYAAANAVLDIAANKQYIHVGYFLLAHAVELGLKAVLAAGGMPKKEIKAAKHDLHGLYAAALAAGMHDVADLHHLIRHLAGMNAKPDYALRYPEGRFTSVPDPAACLTLTQALLESIRPPVNIAGTRDYLRHVLGKGPVEWTD